MHTRSRLGILGVSATVLILGGAAALGTFNGDGSPEAGGHRYPPPGRMVDIGGYKLHLNCTGEGSPTVILEAGNGTMSAGWAWIQPELAKTTRVCSYDRAGSAWSETGPEPRDGVHIAQELHALLAKGGVRGPLVLVGHSFGGLYVRQYAALYSSEVAGLVLVDAAHPDQWTRPSGGQEQLDAMLAMAQQPVVAAPEPPPANPDLPAHASAQVQALTNSTKHLGAAAAEFLATVATNDEVRRTSRTLGALPLVVLSATEHGFPPEISRQLEETHAVLQQELAGLSARGVHRVIAGADHTGLLENETLSRSTSGGVLDVVHAVRTNQSPT